MKRIILSLFLLSSPLGFINISPFLSNQVENQSFISDASRDFLSISLSAFTLSNFSEKEEVLVKKIPCSVEYIDDPELEIGLEEIEKQGKDGQRIETYQVNFWEGKEVSRNLIGIEEIPTEPRVIRKGTKIIIREEDVNGQSIKYWRKLRVWATSYDGNCLGCRGKTYSGTDVNYGTVAVDRNIIPLGTSLYIKGYGFGKAEDTGPAIKGNKIDLGFEDIRNGFWSARWTDVYLLVK